MMNKLVILLLSACCLLTTACDKENDETAQGFRIMKADVDLVAGGGTVGSGFADYRRTNCRFGCGLVQGNRSDKRKDNFACQSQL